MNATQLLAAVQTEVQHGCYSTTSVNLAAANGQPALLVRESGTVLHVRVTVEDAEAKSVRLSLVSENLVVHGEAALSNLPLSVVACLALAMVNA